MSQLSESQAHLLRRLERFVNAPTKSQKVELREQADEIAGICQLTESETALTAICLLFTGMIHSLVRPGKPREDQVQHCYVALLKAVRLFDRSKGSFANYALKRMDGELHHFFRDDHSIRISRTLRQRETELRSAYASLTAELGRNPSLSELVKRLGFSESEIEELRKIRPDRLFVDDPDGRVLGGVSSKESERESVEARVDFERVLANLPEKHARAVRLRVYRELTQQEIGEIVGFSEVHVSRILRRVGGAYHASLQS